MLHKQLGGRNRANLAKGYLRGCITVTALQDLTKSRAHAVAENWFNDPQYYSGAEEWVHKLWNPDGDFRPLFDKMDSSNIVELACGHGRNSWQMRDWNNNITLVDVVPENIEVCRKRFEGRGNVSLIANEGMGYTGMPDTAYSSIFCYDAMVHFDHTVVFAYLVDSARILKQGGMALFHHSNYGANPGGDYTTNPSWRNFMPPGLFVDYAHKAGLKVVHQRILPWGGHVASDALTLLVKA
jgi:SAM-dependent methyltransferase